jgi:hypothetical protein
MYSMHKNLEVFNASTYFIQRNEILKSFIKTNNLLNLCVFNAQKLRGS